jgi:hypothetical protein
MFEQAEQVPWDYEPPRESKKPRKWPPITPHMHLQIKRLYITKVDCSGAVKEFAARHKVPRWKISRSTQEMGWTSKQKKEPNWSAPELRVLKQSAHHSPAIIQRRLKAKGFNRSTVGIVLKRRRMRYLKNLNGQSAQSLAACLGEDGHFVLRAIKRGLLKASRRQQERTPQQGGNTYLIKDKHIKEFIAENVNIIDLRKVDKYWLIDLFTNSEAR